jgi:hypothetical protein
LPPPAAGNAAIAYAPEPSKLAKTINDDIPF